MSATRAICANIHIIDRNNPTWEFELGILDHDLGNFS